MRAIAVAAGLAAMAAVASGQQPTPFRSSLDIVDVYVTVRWQDGAAVRDLDRGNFELRVDGKPREVAVFSRESRPVSVAMILDSSGSIGQADRQRIRQAAQVFVGYLQDRDRMSVHSLYWDCHPLTEDRLALVNALQPMPFFLGDQGSPIWNAVGRAVESLAGEQNRRAILLFSDGQDTGNLIAVNSPGFKPPASPGILQLAKIESSCRWAASRRNLSVGDVRQATARESVMVYAVSANSPGSDQARGLRSLADITFDSGGALHRLGNLSEVRDAFVRIAEELHVQYALGFAQIEFDGKRHDIRVRVDRPNVSVRARRSFLAAKRQ